MLNTRIDEIIQLLEERKNDLITLSTYYNVLEDFSYPLTLHESQMRWNAFVSPGKLSRVIQELPKTIRSLHTGMVAQLQKNQEELQKHIHELQTSAEKYNTNDDYDNADVLASESHILFAQITEAQQLAEKYANEEEMLQLLHHSYPELDELHSSFEPGALLWKAVSEYHAR